ncbi:MAG: isoprenylcysteine carboxylmethyltransferase family protein [Theionarchaea archaeon]|nr:MAG: protein-S-isoprenylcysteine methyltransferase [Theionarchaea archaeon DG-70-1]MBU7028500.1 isoprenylcysteine carboxylmethyltransferase family protein [Theionarchaea archaeon]
MLDNIFEIIFLVGLITYLFGVYAPSVRRYKRSRIADNRMRRQDFLLDLITYAGWQLIPLIYVFTSWLDVANYHLPVWAGWVGVVIFAAALLILWRSYADLGRNWSPTLQIQENHSLVTQGIYHYIRHPIYAALWLWCFAQPLLLQNWIAGLSLLVVFPFLYVLRVPREEQMMRETFGEEYQSYVEKTGRVIPRLWK